MTKYRGDPLYIRNLPRFSSEECIMDLFGQSIAWDCPITNVDIQRQGKAVEAIVWIVTGGDMNETTIDEIVENLHLSTFQGKTIQVRLADQSRSE